MNLRQEARPRALQRLDRHGAGDVGGLRQPARPRERQAGERGHELRPVDQRKSFLGLEHDRLESRRVERGGACHPGSVHPGFAFPDEGQRQVCERREIPACPDGSAAGNVRQDAAI